MKLKDKGELVKSLIERRRQRSRGQKGEICTAAGKEKDGEITEGGTTKAQTEYKWDHQHFRLSFIRNKYCSHQLLSAVDQSSISAQAISTSCDKSHMKNDKPCENGAEDRCPISSCSTEEAAACPERWKTHMSGSFTQARASGLWTVQQCSIMH